MQRLGKNLKGYRGETIQIPDVLSEVEKYARQHGWTSETFHTDGQFHWTALRRHAVAGGSAARRVYISSGIHGDEPAGPLAVIGLLRENQWPDHVDITLCPCLNPTGFAQNTRENAQGLDLNRDFLHLESAEIRAHTSWLQKQDSFDLSLCLHEDWESHGFYLYELNPDSLPSRASTIINAVMKVCPIDLSDVIEEREAAGGIIRPNLDFITRLKWPEAFWLMAHKTRLSYTLETPSDFPLAIRVDALAAGVCAALE